MSVRVAAVPPRAHAAARDGPRRGVLAGRVARGFVRPNVFAVGKVEYHGRGNYWHNPHAYVYAKAQLFKILHGPRGRVQPKGAAARKHDGLYALYRVVAAQKVGLPRAGGAAANVNARHSTRFANYGSAACFCLVVGVVAGFDAANVRNAAAHQLLGIPRRR